MQSRPTGNKPANSSKSILPSWLTLWTRQHSPAKALQRSAAIIPLHEGFAGIGGSGDLVAMPGLVGGLLPIPQTKEPPSK
jgi:hypothetical protein